MNNTARIEIWIRNRLISTGNPQAINLAHNLTVIKTLASQINAVMESKTFRAAKFGKEELYVDYKMIKNLQNPYALSALAIKKFLLVGKLSDSNLAKCGTAVGLLTVDSVVTLSGFVDGVGFLAALGLVSNAYNTYSSCKAVF